MKITRTLELTIENSETVQLRRRHWATSRWCTDCGREVRMLSPEAAGRAMMKSSRRVYADIEAGKLHFVELPDGSLLICSDSLTSSEGNDE